MNGSFIQSSRIFLFSVFVGLGLSGCNAAKVESAPAGISPQVMADSLHAVMEADRTIYTKMIVNRLQNQEKVIKASEHWKDDKALVLPAQMFRMGAERVAESGKAPFSYSLISLWPVNKQNEPKTEAEKKGLEEINKTRLSYYTEEELGGKKYFTALYPDIAVAPACYTCHNKHKDSPKTDFKQGDVMGGVVIRIPLES